MLKKSHISLRVNGEDHEVLFAPHKTLLEVLREEMARIGARSPLSTAVTP